MAAYGCSRVIAQLSLDSFCSPEVKLTMRFQQQRQVKIAGMERSGNKIPVVKHGLHKPLYILLQSEAL